MPEQEIAVEDQGEPAPPQWPTCPVSGCRGARPPDGSADRCLAHLDDTALQKVGRAMVDAGVIDARGCHLSQRLVEGLKEVHWKAGRELQLKAAAAAFDATGELPEGVLEDPSSFVPVSWRCEQAKFAPGVRFQSYWFGPDTSFKAAIFEDSAWFMGAVFQGRAEFAETRFRRGPDFQSVRFQGDASFIRAVFGELTDVFAPRPIRTMFAMAEFGGNASFDYAVFNGRTGFMDVSVVGYMGLSYASLRGGGLIGPIYVRGTCSLEGAELAPDSLIRVSAPSINLRYLRAPEGAVLELRKAKMILGASALGGITTIAAGDVDTRDPLGWHWRSDKDAGVPGERKELGDLPWLPTLRHVDVARLGLTGVDLRACRFTGAYNLDQVRLEPTVAFETTPQRHRWWRWTTREAIAEEHAWRFRHERGVRQVGWSPASTRLPADDPAQDKRGAGSQEGNDDATKAEARQIAAAYRALRKAREDGKDEPGAADFYYGEMEMRRAGTRSPVERAVLWLYWLVSEYALRAWRALATLFLLVVVSGLLLHWVGFAGPGPSASTIAGAITHSAENAVLRSADDTPLTLAGRVIQIGLRLLGFPLFGLALLSLRGRVKR